MPNIVIISSRIVIFERKQHKFNSKAERDAWIKKQNEKERPKPIVQAPKPEPEQVPIVDQQPPTSIPKNPSTPKDVMRLPSNDLVKRPTDLVKRPTDLVKRPTDPVKRPTDPVTRPNDLVELPPMDLVKRPTNPVTRPNGPVELPSKDLVKRPTDPVTRPNGLPMLPAPQQQGEWAIEEGFVEEITVRKAWRKYVRASPK
jgi:hypothetical protein